MAVLRVKILLQSEGSDESIKHAPEKLNQPVMLKREIRVSSVFGSEQLMEG